MDAMSKRKRIATVSALTVVLAGTIWVAQIFSALNALDPSLLISAQLFRPADENNPLNLSVPSWVFDLHWKVAGERIVDRENRSSTEVTKFMLGLELRDERLKYPFDSRRFHELMRRYVCQAAHGIPSLDEVSRTRQRDELPEYVSALEACGRTRG